MSLQFLLLFSDIIYHLDIEENQFPIKDDNAKIEKKGKLVILMNRKLF